MVRFEALLLQVMKDTGMASAYHTDQRRMLGADSDTLLLGPRKPFIV